MTVRLLLADEAVSQGAIDAGIAGTFSYAGTPATEVFEYIQRYAGHSGKIEALDGTGGMSILKIGHFPLPVALIRRLVDHCDDIVVAEDGYPFIERRLHGLLGVPRPPQLCKREATAEAVLV